MLYVCFATFLKSVKKIQMIPCAQRKRRRQENDTMFYELRTSVLSYVCSMVKRDQGNSFGCILIEYLRGAGLKFFLQGSRFAVSHLYRKFTNPFLY